MSYTSSLPIRTESDGDAVIKICDATVESQQLAVNADGSINITDNGAALTVDAVNLDIRDLTSASDSVEVLQASHDDLNANANIQVGNADVGNANPVPVSDSGGSLTVDAVNLDIRDLTSTSDSVEILQDTHDDLNANANIQVGNADVANGNPVPVSDAGGSITVDASQLDIDDLAAAVDSVTAWIVDEAGAAFSAANPLPVVISSDSEGDEISSYQTSAAVAKDAAVNHDYTVSTGKTLLGVEAWVSGSGKLKVEVLVNGVAKFVGFNSTATPNISIPMERIIKATAAQVVRFRITNLDQVQDLYSTLLALEI